MDLRTALALIAALLTAPAAAQQASAPDDDPPPERDAAVLDTVSIVGAGATRQVQRLDAAEAQRRPPGSSPLKLLERLPGVDMQSADPWGTYEWSTRLSIRGFAQQQLGFVLDRVPLGDMNYANHSGLHISRAVIAENLDGIELAQGSAALDTASSGNLGGSVRFATAAPAHDFGVRAAQTFGSEATRRSYARLDTGEHRGTRVLLSGVEHEADKWKGWGPQRQRQFNAKLVHERDLLTLTGYAATSRRAETDYADLSLDSARRLGLDWDNYALDWQRAIDAAEGRYTGGVATLDDAYYLGRGLRDDDLAYLAIDWIPRDTLALTATGYYHRNEGQGHWITPYAASPDVPLALRTTEYDIERSGIVSALAWYAGAHTVEAGLWAERNVHGLQRNLYYLQRANPPDAAVYYRDPDVRIFRQRFDIDTVQWFVQDRWQLYDDRLSIEAGFKSTDVEIDARRLVGTRAAGRLRARDRFLPQAGLRWSLDAANEAFAAYSENIAAFRPGVDGPFSAGQAAFDTFSRGLRPESSRTLEAGMRHVDDTLEAGLAVYHVRFDDRLLAISRCSGIVGCPLGFANVGSVTSRGVEAALLWRPHADWRWYTSAAYNRSRYDDDYLDGATTIPTGGRDVVAAPRRLFATQLAWQRGGLDASLSAKYTDRRYITYTNDASVPGYWVADATIGYRWTGLQWADTVKLQLAVSNLFDRDYFSTVGTNGFVASDPQGMNYTLLAGAPRQWFVTVDVGF